MKKGLLLLLVLIAFQAKAEVVKGLVTRTKDNVAFLQTADGKKVPLVLGENTFYRKKKLANKSKRAIGAKEYYIPLIEKGDRVEIIYDADTVDSTTGTIKASDILIIED